MKKLLRIILALGLSSVLFGQTDNESAALEAHNLERMSLGIEPLKWSNNLTIEAKK